LDYLYRFIDTKEEELNYILCGYFGKIFVHLLTVRGNLMIKYLFNHRFEVIDNFIYHMNRKAISECISRILISPSDEVRSSIEKKTEIVVKLLDRLSNTKDEEACYNASDLLIDSLVNRKFYHLFKINPSLLERLFFILQSNMGNSDFVKEVLKVLIKINENILKDFGNIVTPLFNTEPCNEILLSLGIGDSHIDEEVKVENTPESRANLEKIFEILARSVYLVACDYVREGENEYLDTTFGERRKTLGSKK
jgi:hypothetical protein